MRFAFTSDQLAFRDAVRDLLTKQCPPEAVRAAWEPGPGYDPDTWGHLAEMGVLGLLAPEGHGGLGLTEVDLVLILEESGRACLPGPLVEHAAVAVPTLAAAGPGRAAEWTAAAAGGDLLVTVAEPGRRTVSYGAEAGLVLVVDGDQLRAVESVEVLREERSVDGSRRLAEIMGGTGIPLAGADVALLRARAAVGTAAQLCGLAGRMVEMTADYVKERHQFGLPIGSFQAVKHHLSNALIALEHARPAVYYAAWSLANGLPDVERDCAYAKAVANEASDVAARVALQCHGAIGYTVEHDLQLWLKRAWCLQRAWGDTASCRRHVAGALLA
jgi:alkylation response protein AidB-like acyl-CoA dehydrogenase